MRRLRSFAVGIGLGAAGAVLIARALRQARERLPRVIAAEATRAVASLGDSIRGALAEARRAMAESEATLRAEVEKPGGAELPAAGRP